MHERSVNFFDIAYDKAFREFLANYDIPGVDIEIGFRRGEIAGLTLSILFQNVSSEEIMLRFDSVARSVASDFLFWDMDGNPIEENTSFINRGSSSNRLWEFDAFHPITAGGKWKYELGVHMTDTGLFLDIFNSFPLQFGQTYDVQYRYPFSKNKQDRRSNRLRWTVPAKREIYPKVRIRALLHPPEHYDRWQTNRRPPK
jgi:hypothetical protein